MGLVYPTALPMEVVALRLGLVIHDRALRGAQAMLVADRNAGHAFIASYLSYASWRFAVAHEIAHFLLHRAMTRLPLCLGEDASASIILGFMEREADVFARQLLMPRALIRAMFACEAPSMALATAMATSLEVSLTAAAIRLVEVTHLPMAVVRTRNNVVDWANTNFRFRRVAGIARGNVVDWNSAAFDAKPGSASDPRPLWLASWSPSSAPRAEAIEDVRGVAGGALTLVWIPPSEQNAQTP